jgi:iron complex outermembrane receptor protein
LNNGIAQAGQQWGNDHAPEIDPFVAEHLAVVKGASALAYGGNSLGSVVLIEPSKIHPEPHLHGQFHYIFDTNGGGHTVNAKIERSEDAFSWRFTGTGKIFGDRKAADYFLTNTGSREGNFAIQLEKAFNLNNHSSFYYSYFNTEIGILRGSHISNLTDLEEAIGREIPLFTADEFTYDIDAPRQKVDHHLLKFEHELFLSKNEVIRIVSGTQFNDRKEFDIRRAGRSAKASLSIFQWDQFLESYYQRSLWTSATWKSGLQLNVRDNTNNPETGVLPLIPDFRRFQYSLYSILNNTMESYGYEIGLRSDFQDMEVLSISQSLPREIVRTNHQFQWLSASAGGYVRLAKNLKSKLNFGFVNRPPGVHELYSIGLHQGVSGIEEGDPNLVSERSTKLVASLQYQYRDQFFFELLGYHQQVRDFIYLQVQPEFRLTVQGAFPVFKYQQANAYLQGFDILCSYEPFRQVKWVGKMSYVRGWNIEQDLPLVNIPAPSIDNAIYWHISSRKVFLDPAVSFKSKYVFAQSNYKEGQDILPPPEAYFLTDLEFETHLNIGANRLKIFTRCENVLNIKYRDYLNRLRYFADDQGRNFVVGVQWKY